MTSTHYDAVPQEALMAWGQARSELAPAEGEVFCLFSADWRQTFFVSGTYEDIWGRPCDELFRQPLAWLESVTGETRQRLNNNIGQNAGQAPVSLGLDGVRILRPDGHIRVVNLFLTPLTLNGGQNHHAMIARDFTNYHQLHEAYRSLSVRLDEAKTALNVLLSHAEEERHTLLADLRAGLQRLVMPCLGRLLACHLDDKQRALVELLETNLKALTTPLGRTSSFLMNNLTPRQLEVAQLVREGKSNAEIAEQLNVSENAVAFHRQHIRAKLGIKNQKMNLRSFLQGMTGN